MLNGDAGNELRAGFRGWINQKERKAFKGERGEKKGFRGGGGRKETKLDPLFEVGMRLKVREFRASAGLQGRKVSGEDGTVSAKHRIAGGIAKKGEACFRSQSAKRGQDLDSYLDVEKGKEEETGAHKRGGSGG